MRHVIAAAAMMFALPAAADEIIVGATIDYDTQGFGGVIEYHFDDFYENGGFSAGVAAAARVDADEDAWIGIGVALNQRLSERVFLEFSVMPGFYHAGETELGGDFHFRSLLGIGYDISDTRYVSLSVDHLSNASTMDFNPGSEAVTLRYGLRF